MPWEYPDFCYQVLCAYCHKLVKESVESNRAEGVSMYEEWEIGLDHFGENIFDAFAMDCMGEIGEIPFRLARLERKRLEVAL